MHYVAMNNCNPCMRRCFKYQLWECKNGPVQTWIRAVKFYLKIPIRSEGIMQQRVFNTRFCYESEKKDIRSHINCHSCVEINFEFYGEE